MPSLDTAASYDAPAAPRSADRPIVRAIVRRRLMLSLVLWGTTVWMVFNFPTACAGPAPVEREDRWPAEVAYPGELSGEVRRTNEIVYAERPNRTLRADVYLPPADATPPEGGWPVLVGFHGGSFVGGGRGDISFIAERLVVHGLAFVSCDYRLADQADWPGPVEDARDAVRWVRDQAGEYGWNADKIGAFGRSAGGYYAMMLATDPEPLVRCAINEAGPSNIAPELWDGTLVGSYLLPFFTRTAESPNDPERIREASPALRATAEMAPTLLLHGTTDGTVPISQSYIFNTRMQAIAPDRLTFLCLPHKGHDPLSTALDDHDGWWLAERAILRHLAEAGLLEIDGIAAPE